MTLTLRFDDVSRIRAFTTWLELCIAGSRAKKTSDRSLVVNIPRTYARTVFDVAAEHRAHPIRARTQS